MRINIIIPAYNEEEHIGKTLHSLVNQTIPIHKIIIVNDNSTDGTQKIIESFTNNFLNILIVLIFASLGEAFFKNQDLTLKLLDFFIPSNIVKFSVEVVLVTFLILLFGEVLPKVYASRRALQFCNLMSRPLQFLNLILTPLSYPLINLTKVVEKRLGSKNSNFSVEILSKALELTSEGATTKEEQKILEGIVSFGATLNMYEIITMNKIIAFVPYIKTGP